MLMLDNLVMLTNLAFCRPKITSNEENMMKRGFLVFALCTLLSTSAWAGLEVVKTSVVPEIDGVEDSVWASAPELTVQVAQVPAAIIAKNKEMQTGKYAKNWTKAKPNATTDVKLKALYSDDMIFIRAKWADNSMDDQHKPFKWEGSKDDGEYIAGKEREDRLAFQFPIKGEFSANMLAEVESVVDVWQWKAARTNAAGVIHDKTHIRSMKQLTGKFSTHYSAGGKEIYVARPGDGGKSPYKSNKIDPFEYQGDVIAQYVPLVPDVADAADVKAKGVWKDGFWTVEIARKLDTGNHDTDSVFDPAKGSKSAIAVFDHAGDHFHAASDIFDLTFK